LITDASEIVFCPDIVFQWCRAVEEFPVLKKQKQQLKDLIQSAEELSGRNGNSSKELSCIYNRKIRYRFKLM